MRFLLIALALLITLPALALELQGKAGGEGLFFKDSAKYSKQKDLYYSATLELEAFQEVGESGEIKAKLFGRFDPNSDSRSHGDIRELMFYQYADDWEVQAGIGKVFWGTTESRHLVDVINQVDWIESLDDEARLGQPMAVGKLIKDWGTLDVFVLPYFREMQFMEEEARPRLNPLVDTDNAVYQSDDKEQHIDYAMRWSHTLGDADIGLSYFNGTQRQPLFKPTFSGGEVKLQPVYVQTEQFGLDAQYILGDALWKFEGLVRNSHKVDYSDYQTTAMVGGIEYTLVGIMDTDYDLGLIAEYLYDEWDDTTPFQDDVMVGLRWVMNDEQSTELLVSHTADMEYGSQMWFLNASRRVGEDWKAEVTARLLGKVGSDDPFMQAYRRDDLLQASLVYYF